MLLTFCRGVAQLGRALPWGGRGRTFKSCRSDHEFKDNKTLQKVHGEPVVNQ